MAKYRIIFYLLFDCLTANFVPSFREKGNWSDINHHIRSSFDPKFSGDFVTRLGLRNKVEFQPSA